MQLKQAVETYRAARDRELAATRANLYPTVSGSIAATPQKYSKNQPLFNKANATVYNDLTLGAQASWEPDFWGHVRRGIEQARANALASAADAANVALMLHARLRPTTLRFGRIDSQSKLLTDNVAAFERQLRLTQTRLNGGIATEVDVDQARTQLETVRAQRFGSGAGTANNRNDRQLRSFAILDSAVAARWATAIPIRVPTAIA